MNRPQRRRRSAAAPGLPARRRHDAQPGPDPGTPPGVPRPADPEERFDFRSLFEFSAIINSSSDLTFILGHLLLTVMGKLLSPRGLILLASGEGEFRVQNVRGIGRGLLGTTLPMRKVPATPARVQDLDARRHPWVRELRLHGIGTLVPMTDAGRVVGVLGFADSALGRGLTPRREEYLLSLANIAASAIARAGAVAGIDAANRELSRRVQELNTLFEMSKELSGVRDPALTSKLLMFSVMGQIGAHRCFLSLLRDGRLVHAISRLDGEIPAGAAGWLAGLAEAVVLEPGGRGGDRAARRELHAMGIRAVIPLRAGAEMKGVFGIGGRVNDIPYTRSDLDFLASLGNLAVIALENARLFREALEKQKLEDDLLIAREIQRGLLPAELPRLTGYAVAASNIPSRQVGGDYYDVIPAGDGRWVVAVGDVSGKGTPASLLMANLQASIRALVPLGLSLAELTGRVNDLMIRNTTQGRFITFFWGRLDPATGGFTYVNAGHNPPFVCRADGSLERLEEGGLILGVLPTLRPYREGGAVLGPGDAVCLFTDGVSEAMNPAGEEFGEERIGEILRERRAAPPAEVCRRIVDAVTRWSGSEAQADDITLLHLRRDA